MNFRRRFRPVSSSRATPSGFTLIEIIVVIALMGALATVLAVGGSRLVVERQESPEEVFWMAVAEARKFALHHEVDVTLSFDNEEEAFFAVSDLGNKSVPLPSGLSMQLDFLGVNSGDQTIMIGGSLIEANTLQAVTFYSDGTCMPFRARLEVEARQPVILEIDPWTCAPILRDEENRF